MIDRAIRYVSALLGGLLVFLLGYLLATVGQGSAPPPDALEASPAAETAPPRAEGVPADLATKRVRTIPIRPEDLSGDPGKP